MAILPTTRHDPRPLSRRAPCCARTRCSACTPRWRHWSRLWNSGELAAVQATGLKVANRSHFSAIEEVEDAAPGSDARTGWINRMIGLGPRNGTLDAVQMGMNFPTTALVGPNPTLATDDLDGLLVPGARRAVHPALRLPADRLVHRERSAGVGCPGSGRHLEGSRPEAQVDGRQHGHLPHGLVRDPVRRAVEERRPADPGRHRHRRDRHRRRQLGPAHRLRHDLRRARCRATSPASPRRWPRS